MDISIWLLLLIVCAAGAIGGLVNALLSDNGFFLPDTKQAGDLSILRPGFLGNMLTGMVAAGISWGLYGPLGAAPMFDSITGSESFTLSALVGAVLVGMGGARWITTIVDKKLLTVAASKAAAAPAAPDKALQMLAASPAQVLAIAEKLQARATVILHETFPMLKNGRKPLFTAKTGKRGACDAVTCPSLSCFCGISIYGMLTAPAALPVTTSPQYSVQ